MTDHLAMASQLAGQALKTGYYMTLAQMLDAEARRRGARPGYVPLRPVPTRQDMMQEVGRLWLADAAAVRDGIYPPSEDEPRSPLALLRRAQALLADFPEALDRRQSGDVESSAALADTSDLPDYFTQDFHFQKGGYLTDHSARLYDTQVETLFLGTAGPMRRACLRPIAKFMRGRDQRHIRLLDVACGTGRFLRQARLAYPAMKLTGLDLSRNYLEEARRHMGGLRPANWIAANAESLPLDTASQDIVVSIFLFHELPSEIRHKVAREFARVLRPGGLMIFMDSLQMGDRPGWDGILETFPERFHEPYYQHYATDDLPRLFSGAGLTLESTSLVFLSKLLVMAR